MNKAEIVAVIMAHADDEVLGCGGTIARYVAAEVPVHVLILADGVTSREDQTGEFDLIARQQAAHSANTILGTTSLEIANFPDNRMDGVDLLDIVKRVEVFISRTRPTIVLTHHCGDVNIDHRRTHEAVITACRSQPLFHVKNLMFCEIPSSTEWMPANAAYSFVPSVFVDISETLQKKLDALEAYAEELRAFPHPRSLEAVGALARWRGATAGVFAAEAFIQGRKII